VVGVDIQREALRTARQAGTADYGEMSADALGFRDGAFDLVVSVTVLQHLPPAVRERTLGELFRVLAPGGRVVMHEGERPPSGPAPALFPLREQGWLALFRAAGFEASYLAGSHYLPLLPWAQRAEALARRCLRGRGRRIENSPLADSGRSLVADAARANRCTGRITWLAVMASYPLEYLCARVQPLSAATFRTIVFRKPAEAAL
jgi:SAM-dependent methyltransferase